MLAKELPLIELEAVLSRPLSWRRRLGQLGLALAACALVVVTFWPVLVPATPAQTPLRSQPPPPIVSIISNVNYGSVTINGQPQPGSPPLTLKMSGQPPYSITLDVPPFRPRTCQFPPPQSITPYSFEPCNAGRAITVDPQALNTLIMPFTLVDLPPEQQQEITARIAQALTAQQTIAAPAQSAIVTGLAPDGTIQSQRQTGPLFASAFLVPTTQRGQRDIFCLHLTCVNYSGFSPDYTPSGHFWEVRVPFALRWRFASATGQVISEVTFPVSPTLLTLFLAYDAATGWQVAPLPSSEGSPEQQLAQLLCATGSLMLGDEQAHALSGERWTVATLRNQGVAGCELALQHNNVDQGHFIWRFGVLLAADASAHSTLPALPVALPADLAAVGG
jgi:hypothetical protein